MPTGTWSDYERRFGRETTATAKRLADQVDAHVAKRALPWERVLTQKYVSYKDGRTCVASIELYKTNPRFYLKLARGPAYQDLPELGSLSGHWHSKGHNDWGWDVPIDRALKPDDLGRVLDFAVRHGPQT